MNLSSGEWAAYIAVALAYGGAFYWSVVQATKTKGAKFILAVLSALIGAVWLVTMPIFSFYTMFLSGSRGRA